jgi:hypothetical protein
MNFGKGIMPEYLYPPYSQRHQKHPSRNTWEARDLHMWENCKRF